MSDDLISRQDAINAFDEIHHVLDKKEKELTILPSTQHETQKNAIELGVEYSTKDYTITIITKSTEREVDEHHKMLVREQTFKVEKNG